MKRRSTVTNTKAREAVRSMSREDGGIKTVQYPAAVVEFLKHCRIKGLAKDSVDFYDKELKQIRRAFAEISAPMQDLRKFKAGHIERFIENQLDHGRAVSTINSRLRAGRTFFNFCLRKEYIDANPFDGVKQLVARHEIGPTFTKRQLKKLLDSPNITTFIGLRDLAIMLTLAHTGIRLKELTCLRMQDISFDGKGAVTVQHAKNRHARRIPMTKRLRSVLRAYIDERGALETDVLFVSVEDRPINQRSIQDRLRIYGKASGVDKDVAVSPHAFRRTFCRLKVEAGTNIFVLQRLTGHHSLEVLRRYVQIYGKDLEDAIEQGLDDM